MERKKKLSRPSDVSERGIVHRGVYPPCSIFLWAVALVL